MADNNTIARPYARAAFELAQKKKTLPKWSEALIAATGVLADGQVVKFLGTPSLSDEQRLEFLTGLFKKAGGKASILGGGSKDGNNFLKLLIEYGRVGVLPEISAQFEALKAKVENTIDVTVTSAVAISATQQEAISEALKKRLGRTVRLETQIDASLIGGAVIRAGDIVIDASLRLRLDGLANAMVS